MKNKMTLTAIIIFICLAAGFYFEYFSKSIDSPIEQAAEEILKNNGINIDFSEQKKIRE